LVNTEINPSDDRLPVKHLKHLSQFNIKPGVDA